MEWTEAHEAMTPAKALLALRHIAEAYYLDEETLGVLNMYEHAAADLGCDAVAIHTTKASAKARAQTRRALREIAGDTEAD